MDGKIRRANVYRYTKSGKLVAVIPLGRGSGCMVLNLANDISSITQVSNKRYVKFDLLTNTKYQIEVRETPIQKTEGAFFSYRLIRVLSSDDVNLNIWKSTNSLNSSPVSPELEATPEELFWAGKRPGNIGGGIALVLATTAAVFIAATANGGASAFFALVAAIPGWFLLRYQWRPSLPPAPNKIEALTEHKRILRERSMSDQQSALTKFDVLLREKKNWDLLSPEQFELALAIRLKSKGYQVKATRYSKDGGIDIEAISATGQLTIVQAKKYASNVGVAVVREMIGIRESRSDRPHTIIYSLNGFSSGARTLAAQTGIQLLDIKSELLSI